MPKALKTPLVVSIKLPPNMAAAGWDIDAKRLIEFCKHFGITNRIRFRWTKGYGTVGAHRLFTEPNGERWHGITLNQWRPIEESRNTILHELCHAIQKDSVNVGEWNARRKAERKRSGYYNSDIEIEARNFAEEMMAEWGDILY